METELRANAVTLFSLSTRFCSLKWIQKVNFYDKGYNHRKSEYSVKAMRTSYTYVTAFNVKESAGGNET